MPDEEPVLHRNLFGLWVPWNPQSEPTQPTRQELEEMLDEKREDVAHLLVLVQRMKAEATRAYATAWDYESKRSPEDLDEGDAVIGVLQVILYKIMLMEG